MSTDVAAAEQQAPAAALVTDPAVVAEAAAHAARSCRGILATASQWYEAAKDYVPDVAKPLVEGDTITVTLSFKVHGTMTLDVPVLSEAP